MDQPGKVANPALVVRSTEKTFFFLSLFAPEKFGFARQVRSILPGSDISFLQLVYQSSCVCGFRSGKLEN